MGSDAKLGEPLVPTIHKRNTQVVSREPPDASLVYGQWLKKTTPSAWPPLPEQPPLYAIYWATS